jgi:hypothetical protein
VTEQPLDPNEFSVVELGSHGGDDAAPPPRHVWRYVIAAGVLVVVGMVAGIVVFNNSAADTTRGARTATDAAREFVHALNAGDEKTAAGVSCDSYADGARAAARSGSQGVGYTLVAVRTVADGTATASITAALDVGGQQQTNSLSVNVFRTGRLWLVCGPAS